MAAIINILNDTTSREATLTYCKHRGQRADTACSWGNPLCGLEVDWQIVNSSKAASLTAGDICIRNRVHEWMIKDVSNSQEIENK